MDPKEKDQDDPKTNAQDKEKTDEKDQVDPKIAELQKDPDAIASLLATKRKANAEAQTYREKLEKLEKEQQEAANKALEEQGKYKELNEKLKAEKEEATTKFRALAISMALKAEAIQLGITDPDLVALIDTKDVKIDDDFNVENAKQIVEAFKEAKPHFFGEKEEEGDPPPNPKPGLKQKVKGIQEGITPEQKIDNYFKSKT